MNAPIQFVAPVEITAAAKGPRRFSTVAYTGGALMVSGYGLPIVVDLAGLSTRKSVTANLDHDSSKRVGHIEDVQNDGAQLVLAGVVSAVNEAATEFVASHDNGYRWQASIEASPERIEEIRKGESVEANGRTFTGPLLVTRKSVLSAVAFVPNGADDLTSVSIAAMRKAKVMRDSSSFTDWVSSMQTTDISDLTSAQLATLHANYEGRTDANDSDFAATAPLILASGDPVAAEEKRLRQIEAATRGEWGEYAERVQKLKAEAVSGESTVEELLDDLRHIRREKLEASIPMAHTVYGSSRDMHPQVIECAFALAGGLSKPEAHYPEQVLDAADKMRGSVSLQQLLMEAACANGLQARPGQSINQGNIRQVLQAAFAPVKAGGFSTLSLPNTLSNVSSKYLRDGFMSVDQTCLRIAFIRPVRNFKELTTVSLTGGMMFEEIAADGQIKHGDLGEEVYHNQIATRGAMFAITTVDIINDDLDALTAVPRRIGRGGMLKLNDIFWTEFLDNSTFFSAGNNNVNTGVADMTLGGLEATENIFVNQQDPDGNTLGVNAAILLVPPALKAAALVLMNSQNVVTGSDVTLGSTNIWKSRFTVESSAYMQNSAYTGSSSAAWYLLSDPAQLPAIEIAALNGKVEPTVETADVDFSMLGIQMRGYSDVGVRKQEFRAGVRADGGSS